MAVLDEESHMTEAAGELFGCIDLVEMILAKAQLGPRAFVAVSGVSKAWNAACRRNERLLVGCAANSTLTKGILMGLFALSSAEANRLPRTVRLRRDGGVAYQYEPEQAAAALVLVGGVKGRCARLKKRAAYEADMQQALGKGWRCGWWGDGRWGKGGQNSMNVYRGGWPLWERKSKVARI